MRLSQLYGQLLNSCVARAEASTSEPSFCSSSVNGIVMVDCDFAYKIPQPRAPCLSYRESSSGRDLEVRAVDDVELDSISRLTLSVHRQFLLQMIAVEIIPSWAYVPGAKALAIDAVKVYFANDGGKVVFGDVGTVGTLESLVLNLCTSHNIIQRRQNFILDIGTAVRECGVVETIESSKDSEFGERLVHNILICASELGGNDPVQIYLSRRKDHIKMV